MRPGNCVKAKLKTELSVYTCERFLKAYGYGQNESSTTGNTV